MAYLHAKPQTKQARLSKLNGTDGIVLRSCSGRVMQSQSTDSEQNPQDSSEANAQTKSNLDPKVIQQLEVEIMRAVQESHTPASGSQPNKSVQSSSTASSLYSKSASVSMESFTLDSMGTTPTVTVTHARKDTSCCGSSKPVEVPPEEELAITQKLPDLLPPPAPEDAKKICLVLDLDETLVHSSFQPLPDPHFSFSVGNEDNEVGFFVYIRPGAEQFLKELGPLYELVVFTASCQLYADQVIDYIDPDRVVKYRLYRESCTDFGGSRVKDLSRLNRPLERVIILDNSPSAYLLHPYNAIAITSWFDDPGDRELMRLRDFLKQSYRIRNVYDLLSE